MKKNLNNKHKNVLLNICTARDGRASLAGVRGHILRVWPLFIAKILQISHRSTSRARVLNGVCSEGFLGRIQLSTSRARVLNAGSGLGFYDQPSLKSGLTSRARVLILTLVMVIISSTMYGLVGQDTASAAPSETLNFQGRIQTISGGLVSDGFYNIEFNLYDTDSGGTSLWTETRDYNGGAPDNRVRVTNGYFSVYLGDITALPNIDYSQELYLTMNIGGSGTSATWDGEMNPRFRLTAVPYAFRAANVSSGDTNTASTNSNGVSITTGDALGVTSNSGDITIDTGTATGTTGIISLGSTNASALTLGRAGLTTTNAGALTVSELLTASGNLQVNGNTTLGSDTSDTLTVEANATFNGSLAVSAGDQFTNAGATLFTAITINDDVDGGVLGSNASTTVDVATTLNVNQTTASQTFTLPSPTTTAAGRILYINNVGTAEFTLEGNPIASGESASYIWNGTSWVQTISFTSTGVDTIGALDGGTPSANGAFISGTTIYLQSASATQPGLVNTSAQTFAGVKTFNDGAVIAAGQTLRVIGGNTASRPGSPSAGELYYDTDTNQFMFYNGTKWIADQRDAIYVASTSTSSQADQDRADYLVDGTSDQTEINSALTAAAGAKVVLLEGTYVADGTITVPDNTTLEGIGAGTIVQMSASVADNLIENTNQVDATGISIRNMTLDNTPSTAGAQGAIVLNNLGDDTATTLDYGGVITGLTIKGSFNNGINISNSANIFVSENYLEEISGSTAIYAGNSTLITIANNTIVDETGQASIYTSTTTQSTITGNIILRGTVGLFIGNSDNMTISNNTIKDTSGDGIYISNSSGNNITGNVIGNSGGSTSFDGIVLVNDSDTQIISSNRISDTACDTTCYAIDISSNSNLNYLSNNFINDSDVDDVWSINDASADTIYASQATVGVGFSTGGSVYKQTNSTTAFAVQNASGTSILNVDTTNSELEVTGGIIATGNLQIDGNTTLGSDSTDTLTINAGTSGSGIRFNSNFQNCTALETDAEGDLVCGSDDGNTYTAGNDIDITGGQIDIESQLDFVTVINQTSANLTLQTTTSGDILVNAADTFNVNSGELLVNATGDVSTTGALTVTGLTTLNGGLTVEAGDTFTFNTDAFTDFTGGGLYNNSGLLSVTNTGASGFFQNAGNSFGVAAVLGTNDAYSLSLETNGTTRLIVQTDGDVDILGSTSISGSSTSVLTGSIDPDGTATVTGVGTAFTTELVVGDRISVSGETRIVTAIASDTSLTVSYAFSNNPNDTSPDRLPALLTVNNSSGNLSYVITDNGGIGVGVAAPDGQLANVMNRNVANSLSAGINPNGLRWESNGVGYASIITNNSATGGSSGLMVRTLNSGGNEFVFTAGTGTTVGANANDIFIVRSDSRVGILDVTPTNTLDVTGSIGISDTTVISSGRALQNITGYSQGSGNFAITGAGTFSTGTGAISLNGATSITGTNTLTVGTGLTSLGGALTVTGLTTLNGGLTIETGDTFTFNGDAFTDLTGNGLQVSGNALTLQVQANKGLEVDANGISLIDCGDNQILKYSTGTSQWTCSDDIDSKTATYIVAPTGSGIQADYYTDGTDDQVQINAALTAAAGGKVYLAEGVYTVDITDSGDATIFVPNNTTLEGAGAGTIIEIGDIDVTDNIIENSDTTTGTGVVIKNLTLDGRNDLNTAGNQRAISFTGLGSNASSRPGAIISGITANRFRSTAIRIDTSSYITITDSNIVNAGYGFFVTSSSHLQIRGNIIDATTFDAINIGTVTNTTIANNHVTNGGASAIVVSTNSTENVVTGNIVDSNTDYGIFVGSGANYNLISNNSLIENGTVFKNLRIEGGDYNRITNNYIYNADTSGPAIAVATAASENNYIADNTYSGTGAAGITNTGTNTIFAGQVDDSGNYEIQPTGAIELLANTSVVGTSTLTVGTGLTSLGGALTVTGTSTFNGNLVIGDANTDTITINAGSSGSGITFSDVSFQNCVLTTSATGVLTCATSGALITLQGAYTGGNSITTTDARDIIFSLADTTTDSDFIVDLLGTGNTFEVRDGGTAVLSVVDGGAATFQNTVNSGSAFTVNDQAGSSILSVDTTNYAVKVSSSVYKTATNAVCNVNCTISQANIDTNAAIIVEATAGSLEISIPDPTDTTAGRLVYITAANGSEDFTLIANGGGTNNEIAMRQNTTATMIWNGSDWTAAGASSSTTLQAAYDNTLTSAGGAEIVLNNSPTSNGLTVRNNATSPIIGSIFEAQTAIGSNLFSVNNNAVEYANNGGAENAFSGDWSNTPGGGTVTRYTTQGDYIATGVGSVEVATTGSGSANQGAENTLISTLTANLQYSVSFAMRGTTSFSTVDVYYSPDGTTTGEVACTTGETVTQGKWTRVICTFYAPASGITSSNAIFIRQSDSNTTARTYYVENLSVTVKADVNHAVDGDVDDAGNFSSYWTSFGSSTVVRETTVIYNTNGSTQVDTTAAVGDGVRNNLAITPSINTQYLVTFYARSSNTFDDIRVRYSRDGGTSFVSCTDYNTQSVSTSSWTRITCLLKTDGTTPTNPDLIIDQPTATARTFYVDGLEMTLNENTASNVQIGGGNLGGPTTLLTLDRSAGPPVAANNDAYLGSMYFDTTTGRIQCYEAGGWGTCGAPPDNIVNLNPEYAGSVLNGSGIGTMQADVCANETGVLQVNSTLCGSGEARSFYTWTSPQATEQTYSIYVTYQLPSTFDGFASDDTVTLTGRVSNTTNAAVTYEMFRSENGSITKCGTGETTVATSANTWQTVGINGNEATGCGFTSNSANAFVIFKINLKANSNADAYVSTLSFTTTGR